MRGGNLNSSTEHKHDFNTKAWLPSSGTKASHVLFAEHNTCTKLETQQNYCYEVIVFVMQTYKAAERQFLNSDTGNYIFLNCKRIHQCSLPYMQQKTAKDV